MKKQMLFFFAFLFAYALQAQNVGIGTTTPDASAALDVSSTTQGTLITRMTTAQRRSITSPAPGLLVYDLDKKTIYMWNGHDWLPFLFAGDESEIPTVVVQEEGDKFTSGFGHSVAMDGNYAVVGSFTENVGGNSLQGSAYVFKRNGATWTQMAQLVASDGEGYEWFGNAVAISGNYIVVGAFGHDVGGNTSQGCAYVFFNKGGTWVQAAQLFANDGAENDRFGGDVAISGNYIVVGAKDDDVGTNTNQGSAYVFTGSGINWTQQDKLVANDGQANGAFGTSLSISGDYLVVGAPNEGSAYVYGRIGTNWAQLTKIHGGSTSYYSAFGYDVCLKGDFILVGEPNYGFDSNLEEEGQVVRYYKGAGWVNGAQYIYSFSSGVPQGHFGRSVALFGDYFLAGSLNANGYGTAHLYKKNEYGQYVHQRTIEDRNPLGDYFGESLAGSGQNIIIGAQNISSEPCEVHFLNLE